ncbi:MAG: Holliday junction resolvase RuvX, partial [Phycisphaerae bacterium]
YAEWLGTLLQLPWTFQDERFSSAQAESLLLQAEMTKKQRQARLDKLAAQVLLQAYLDRRVHEQQDGRDSSTTDPLGSWYES